MSEENKQDPQGQNQDDNKNDDNNEEKITFTEDELYLMDEGVKSKIKKLEERPWQTKHWREKHDKIAGEYDEYKKKNPEKTPEKKNEPPALEDKITSLELKQSNPNLDDDDIKKAIALAKVEGVTPLEASKSDLFAAYLEKKTEKKKNDNATPLPSNRGGQSSGKDFSKVLENPELIREMSQEEYEEFKAWKEVNKK